MFSTILEIMKRREFLTTLGLGSSLSLAGCMSQNNPSNTTSNSISRLQIETNKDDTISYSANFIEQTESADQPIQFTISFTNISDETVTIANPEQLLFDSVLDSNQEIVLLSSRDDISFSNSEPCWTLSEIPITDSESVELQPEETLSEDLYLVSYNTGCSSVDSLSFETTSYIYNNKSLSQGIVLESTLTVE